MRRLKISKSITTRDVLSLEKYLQDISKLPMVTVEEEIALAEKIKKGDTLALEALVVANLRFVVSVAKQYQNQGVGLSDLINEGNMGLIKAATRFDEKRGFKFISYAVWWIRQSIMQAVCEQARIIRIPLNKAGMLSKIKKAQSNLEQSLERTPSSGELAEVLAINEKEIVQTMQAGIWHISTSQSLNNGEATILDLQEDRTEARPDEHLMRESFKAEVERSLKTLTDRERDVLVLFYGIGQSSGISLSEIGEKFELTPERVRQIREVALKKLRKAIRTKTCGHI